MIGAGSLLSRKYPAGELPGDARLQSCPNEKCVGAITTPASGPFPIPSWRPRCVMSVSSGNSSILRVLSTTARLRSRKSRILAAISSRERKRSSAGREAHCRLACIKFVMVFNLSAIESGSALNAERPHQHAAGRAHRLQMADGLGDEFLLLRLGHVLQAMGDGAG